MVPVPETFSTMAVWYRAEMKSSKAKLDKYFLVLGEHTVLGVRISQEGVD